MIHLCLPMCSFALGFIVGPASPLVMNYSNIGARHMDLTWRVAPDLWDAYTTTGYWSVAPMACLCFSVVLMGHEVPCHA